MVRVRPPFLSWICWPLLTLAGCGEAPPLETHPIRGKILVDGMPAKDALVVLFPVDLRAEAKTLAPSGTTDAQGYFSLSSFRPNDGAPAGDYHMTVVWRGPTPEEPMHPDKVASRPDLLGGKYAEPTTSELKVTISKEQADLGAFELRKAK